MRYAVVAASVLALSTVAAPAFAQDTGDSSEATFTGPRAEAIVGWDHVNDDSLYGANKDGIVYGGAIGYDHQIGRAVIGVEAEATGATTKDTDTGVLVAGDTLRVKAGRDLYAGGRVGYVVGGNALIYAKGGYTNAMVSTRYVSGTNTSSFKDNFEGWRIGAGAEVKLTGKVYVKGEYRYSNYGDDNAAGPNVKRQQVVGGVGIRF